MAHVSTNPFLKKAFQKQEFTEEQVSEILKCIEDPEYFFRNYYYVKTADGGEVLFEPYPYQKRFLDAMINNRFVIGRMPRQSGKCFDENTIIKVHDIKTKEVKAISVRELYNTYENIRKPSESINAKFIESFELYNIEIWTDSGWQRASHLHRTVKYEKWLLKTTNHQIICADDHIVFKEDHSEVYVKDLNIGDLIFTENGLERVISVENMHESDHMFDLTIDSNDHRFYTNGILSHNSTVVVAFFLYSILFFPNREILLLSKTEADAISLLNRIKFAYEKIEPWMQVGILNNAAKEFSLENGSLIRVRATTEAAGRSGSYYCVFCDEYAFIPQNIADDFYTSAYPTISSGKESKFIMISCVTKDAFVFTPHGPRAISEFIDEDISPNSKLGYKTLPYAIVGKDNVYNGDIIVNSGRSETLKISTRYSNVECSPNHKLWICDQNGNYGYKESKDIKIGDWVGLRYGLNLWGNYDSIVDLQRELSWKEHSRFEVPDMISNDLAYFMGLFLAEGYARDIYNKKGELIGGQIIITCGDDISEIFTKLNLKFNKYDDVHYTVNSKSLLLFLKDFGFDITKKAKEKIIPDRLFMCSERVICNFLKGYFDGDGCISKRQISVSSASKRMIEQIRILLMNLGILCTYDYHKTPPTKKVKVWSEQHILEIYSFVFKQLYMDKIGFGLKRKRERWDKVKSEFGITKDIIPFGRRMFSIPEPASFKNDTGHISRKRCLEAGIFNEIVDPNITWDVVKKIEYGENEVFDFSLPHDPNNKWCHSVLYNGLIGHQTPNGLNHFYDMWTKAEEGRSSFIPVSAEWWEHPDRDEEWAKEQERNLGPEKFAQEVLCEFLGAENALISSARLKAMQVCDPIYVQNGYEFWELPKPGHNYVICVDLAEGIGRDYTVASIIDVTQVPYMYCGRYRSNTVSPLSMPKLLYSLGKQFNYAHILIETGAACAGIGDQVGNTLYYILEYENMVCSTKGVGRQGQELEWTPGKGRNMGVRTTRSTKAKGCAAIKSLVENNQIIIRDALVRREFSTFKKIGNTFKAEEGIHDDTISTLLIFGWLSKQQNWEDLFKDKAEPKEEETFVLPILTGYEEETIVDSGLLWTKIGSIGFFG